MRTGSRPEVRDGGRVDERMKGGAERAQRAKRNLGLMSKMVKVGPQNSRKMVKVAAHVDRRKTVKVPTLQKPNPHPMVRCTLHLCAVAVPASAYCRE